ncbi:MAG: TIM barrel protein [Planctomycetes bacterium]|nr:TIM barrel protein [Planctomycetota bacterium]
MAYTRRDVLLSAAGLAVGAGAVAAELAAADEKPAEIERVATRGRIRQSLVHWCFQKYWPIEKMARIAAGLGLESIELVSPQHWPVLKQHGLACAIASVDMSPDPPFMKGFNNPRYHARVIEATKRSIDAAAEFGVPSVIAFTGYKYRDADDPSSGEISPDEGIKNCVEAFKRVLGHAEKAGVTLCLEMLNTRDDSHPMKGHPGYQGDSTEYCVEIIDRVGSPRLKLLFDIYHVQIMDGDVIRRIRQHKDVIGHIHTAGNPGRGELDADQEINYPAVMKALVEVGYRGYVGQEFIPTRDPLAGLKQAAALCDV